MATGEPLRHRREKAHLMKRMSRKHGTWNTAHPRYRLLEALYGFAKYRERNMAELDRWRARYGKMLEKAVDYKRKLRNIEQQIYENEVLCNAIVDYATTFYGIEQKELAAHIKDAEKAGRVADRIGPSQTLKHFVRDWADDGSKERDDAFPCILTTLSALAPPAASPRLRILLPGSGLGRLGTEIANLGRFQVTLNEYSMAMNIAYRFLTSTPAQHFAFHPFVDALSHHSTTANLLRRVDAPNAPPNPDVLLVEGDFNTAFNDQQAAFDVVVTHFFIDTARNLVAYFDTIHRLLAPGGRWVNLGPLLYGTAPLVQLSLDEIVAVVEAMGFEFEDVGGQCGALSFEGEEGGRGKVRWMEAEYGFDPRALVRNAYKAQVWVVRKV
ncbi:N2227-domain-containing protein [Didymella exigua CBS 183.55]|uniref:N2227-domain-containing protein n=1 Tax=Didymella exigua CBS 183.55 TaxID=1150837 RepID=A0A6A5REW3_9PLEO|nr:N2227-domain-containing protein [Didymella exigua CBS 183.55]KAF1925979.1 N2227-domain-containing protein [Didymella exigua CBS 183.55]